MLKTYLQFFDLAQMSLKIWGTNVKLKTNTYLDI